MLYCTAQHLLPSWLKKSSPERPRFQHIAVHPCVINDQPHIVYPRGLKEQSPHFYKQLHTHFKQRGYRLKEEQRSESSTPHRQHERRGWVPVLLFTASLLFESNAYAEAEFDIDDHTAHEHHQIELQLVSNTAIRSQIKKATPAEQWHEPTTLNNKTSKEIFELFSKHYRGDDTDPSYILDDFKQIANYYSKFPEVVALLRTLDNKKWTLQFDEDNWVTIASGNIFEVHNAVIHFNTRSAAQLRLNNGCKSNPVCIASPADALLHELLHTHSMLVTPEKFIAQGGMNSVMYPYKHEYSIIEAERNLYLKMSKQDTKKRPYRVEHTGRIVKTHCPTCI